MGAYFVRDEKHFDTKPHGFRFVFRSTAIQEN
jgi:hypothetical protein